MLRTPPQRRSRAALQKLGSGESLRTVFIALAANVVIGVLLIAILLAITAFGLARPLADFLVGRSLPPELLLELQTIIEASPVIEQVISLQVVYTGPEEVIVAAKVRPSKKTTVEELARAMDELDHKLRDSSEFVADLPSLARLIGFQEC